MQTTIRRQVTSPFTGRGDSCRCADKQASSPASGFSRCSIVPLSIVITDKTPEFVAIGAERPPVGSISAVTTLQRGARKRHSRCWERNATAGTNMKLGGCPAQWRIGQPLELVVPTTVTDSLPCLLLSRSLVAVRLPANMDRARERACKKNRSFSLVPRSVHQSMVYGTR